MSTQPLAFLSAISSDIGLALGQRYLRDGWSVAGTYRSRSLLGDIDIAEHNLHYCDLADVSTVNAAIEYFKSQGPRWDTFISLASWPPPLSSFFDSSFDEWSQSVHINAIEQLRMLHGLYNLRRPDTINNVVFFAGPGTNGAPKNFSALTLSKIMLIKMCELLDAECPDLNVFIVGPGWTRTKTHDKILSDPNVSEEKRRETEAFLAQNQGTTMDDIYEHIRWLTRQGRSVAGGRNFSTVHDLWRSPRDSELAAALRMDKDMYKLRRFKNDFLTRDTEAPKRTEET